MRKAKRKKIKKNKRHLKIIFVVVLMISIIITGFSFHLSSNSPIKSLFVSLPTSDDIVPPDELLQRFFAYIESGQFEHMYNMLDYVSQMTISKEDFIDRNRNIYNGIGVNNITITINQMREIYDRPDRKIVEYNLRMDTIAGEIAHDHQAIFVLNENNEFRLQWTSRTIFPQLGDNDRVRTNILPARRGSIFDRNGNMLAGLGYASAVGFVPGRMRRDEIEKDIVKIANLLEMTPEAIIRRLEASYVRDDTFVLLRTISREAQELIDELLTVQGIMVSTTTVRYYPLERSAAHLLGYVQNINAEELEALSGEGYHMNSVIGRAGLERIYEEQLRARDGREIFIIDNQGNRIATLAQLAPINGQDIHLTIDSNLQRQLYDLFATDKSASVAMNPLTGEVLALVSTPSYDPNDFVRGMTPSVWQTLNEDEHLPLFNRFRATFSPGSTMKAITAVIGIDSSIINPNEDFGHSGQRWQLNESWGGFFVTTVREYYGAANLYNAMAWSDNIYFAKAALRIGAEIFENGLIGLGFGERIPFEYGVFSSTISRTGMFTSDIQLADSGYGQGEILMNPLHLAVIYAAFVNDGNIIEPRLIYGNPSVTAWIPNAFSPDTARTVLDSLIFSIEYGTGRGARIPGVNLAGKTGTAEIKLTQNDETGTELGWFVLLTADDNAEAPLLVISMVEDVQGRGGSGYVVPRVREVFYGR